MSRIISKNVKNILNMENLINLTRTNVTSLNAFQITIGTSFIFISCFFMIFYGSVLYFLINDEKQSKYNYHKIIICIGIFDILQLFSGSFTSGLYTLIQFDVPVWSSKLTGSVTNSAWFSYLISCHLLAINRFVAVIFPTKSDVIFSKTCMSIYLAMIWLFAGVGLTLHLTLDFKFSFNPQLQSWLYDDTPFAEKVIWFDICWNMFNIVGMFIWYTCVYVYLKMKVIFLINKSISIDN